MVMTSRSVMSSSSSLVVSVLLIVFSISGTHIIAASDVTSYVSIPTRLASPINVPNIVNDVMTAFSSTDAVGYNDDDVVSTAGCGTTKGCLHYPIGCQSPGDCTSVLTWTTTEPGFVNFEMMASSNGWVAVALSPTRSMRNNSVIQCVVDAASGNVSVGLSFNTITAQEGNIPIQGYSTILRLTSFSYVNGVIQCRFQRSIPGESTEIFPLDEAYYLFFGVGPVSENGTMLEHTVDPQRTTAKVTLSSDLGDLTAQSSTLSTASITPSMNDSSSSTVMTSLTPPSADGCNVTLGCFNDTMGNTVLYSLTDDGLNIQFEIACKRNETNGIGWCAVGFSETRRMGETSVIDCVRTTDGLITVQHSYNEGLENIIVDNATDGLTNVSTQYVDGVFSCRFHRSIVVNSNDQIYDLNKPYYLQLGSGPLDSTAQSVKTTNLKLEHEKKPARSSTLVDVRYLNTTTPSTTASTSTTTVVPPSECGVNRGCFADKHGNVVTYSSTSDGLDIQFEITCQQQDTTGWCSVGFSNSNSMGPASVIDCIRDRSGQITVKHSFNELRKNVEINNATDYLNVISSSYNNGVLTCAFFRRITVTGNDNIFSLDSPYYALLGYGPISATSGSKSEHTATPAISSTKIDFRETVSVTPSEGCDSCLLRAHGCLMITAWVLLVSTSIILARYFKTAWPGDKICDTAIWFAAHRFIMVLALICTATGFIIIFVHTEGRYIKFPDDAYNYFELHAPLGIIVMVLVIVNPFMTLFRCDPGTAKRPIFNWLHWLVGTTCHVLAMITVFIGVKIGEKSHGEDHISHSAIFWMLLGFVIFHCVVEVALTAHKMASDIAAKSTTKKKYETEEGNDVQKVDSAAPNDLKFRYAVLTVYGIVVLGLWLAMVIMMGSGIVDE